MVTEWLENVGFILLGYLSFGYMWSWIWLFEARIKCMDKKIKAWEDHLSSMSGIISFQVLCTIFWLPVLYSRISTKYKKRKYQGFRIMVQQTIEIWDFLSSKKSK